MRARVSVSRAAVAVAAVTMAMAGAQAFAPTLASAVPPPPSVCDAIAGNLVLNCGFEGRITELTSEAYQPDDWTLTPASSGPDSGAYVNASEAHSGDAYFYFAATGTIDDVLSQVIPTVADGQYTLTFWKSSEGSDPSDFSAKVTGSTGLLASYSLSSSPPASGYVEQTLNFVSPGGPVTISFAGLQKSGYYGLDDVSLVLAPPSVPTTTTVSIQSGSVAEVDVVPSAVPELTHLSGTVDVTVAGADVGSAPISADGTLSVALPRFARPGSSVIASYSGDGTYLPSSGLTTTPESSGQVTDPTITAHVHNAHGKHHGWYRSAVTVSFTCTGGNDGLTEPCPGSVTRSKNGENQKVSKTVYGYGGGSATATVYPINIDTTPPTLTVSGGHCVAHDSLSGPGSCHVVVNGSHWTATGTDRAGNVTVRRG